MDVRAIGNQSDKPQPNEDSADTVTAQLPEHTRSGQESGCSARGKRIGRIGRCSHGNKYRAKRHALSGDIPRRSHELRKKGRKENGGLGVQERDKEPVTENPHHRFRGWLHTHSRGLARVPYRLHPKIHEIGRPSPFDQCESDRGHSKKCGQPQRRTHSISKVSQCHATDRCQAILSALKTAARDDVENTRSGSNGKDETCEEKCTENGSGRQQFGHHVSRIRFVFISTFR